LVFRNLVYEARSVAELGNKSNTRVQQLRSSLIELGVKEGELPKKKDALWEMWTEKKKNTTPLALYVVLGIFSGRQCPRLLGGKTQLIAAQLTPGSEGGYSAASPLALEKRNLDADVLQQANRTYMVDLDSQLLKLTPEKLATKLVGLQGNSNLGWKVDADTAKGVNTTTRLTRATTVSGLSSAEKKKQDDQDQLIRQLQAKLAAAEKKKRLQKEIVGVLMVAKLLQTANEKRFAAAPESAAPSVKASQKVAAVASTPGLLDYLLEQSKMQETERERERRRAAEQEQRQADERKQIREGMFAVTLAAIVSGGQPKASEPGQATSIGIWTSAK